MHVCRGDTCGWSLGSEEWTSFLGKENGGEKRDQVPQNSGMEQL